MALPTTWDSLFRKYAGQVPVAYLRALSKKESDMNPSSAGGAAWGLMQIVPVVRQGFNERFGTNYSQSDLLDPDLNVRMAADLLNRITTAYAKHPDPNMKPDWSNPEFAKLVTAGWNSGYSEGGGVGKVAKYLESRGIPVTHDNVFRYSQDAGATQWLRDGAKQSWQRGVVALYQSEPDASGGIGGAGFWVKVGVASALGLLIARVLR